VLADDPMYKEFLSELRKVVLSIMDQWDVLREKYNEDGDPDNTTRETSQFKKAKSLYREVAKEYSGTTDRGNNNDKFIRDLTNDAAFNSNSYVQCFISENLLRRKIENDSTAPAACLNIDLKHQTCVDRYDPKIGAVSLCRYCKGERRKKGLQTEKAEASMAIPIRVSENNLLLYLDYIDLANIIDDRVLTNEEKVYRPLRNSVMHTSLLTDQAKTRLSAVFDNIIETVKKTHVGFDKIK